MRIHRSNRVEELLSVLARILADPLADPFAPEWIVVQGPGMERFLSLELSRELGVFAHPQFPFPRTFLRKVIAEVLGEEGDDSSHYEPERLMWSVAASLPERLDDPAFASLAHYLDGDTGGEKALQLARRIANTFDHYVIHRPEMILAWDRGERGDVGGLPAEEVAWQHGLWQELVAQCGPGHLAARTLAFVSAMDSAESVPHGLPERISVFGLSTLPPLFVEGLAAFSRQVNTHLFLLSPSREYWGHIRSEREQARSGAPAAAEEALHFEQGHPLLASLGRVGREFQEVLESRVDYLEGEEDLYVDPGEGSVLHAIQSDILNLRDPSSSAFGEASRRSFSASDDSISVHACHGPMRESEVLRDRLLDLFESDPSLEARDVVIMTPNVDRHAPFVEAALASGGPPGLALRVADRPALRSFEVLEAFMRLLDTLLGRLRASDVLDLLATPCIRARFGLAEEDESRLRTWVESSGVRWGADQFHREAEGQPRVDQNTWQFGLDRLLLGFAMADEGHRLFGELRPQEGAPGSEAESLGRLVELVETLGQLHQQARGPRSPEAWVPWLEQVIERVLHDDGETVYQRRQLRDAVQGWASSAARGGYGAAMSLTCVRDTLSPWLEERRAGGGFLAGGVTLCELVPMRTIPFRVVCLMGMDDEAFPRIERKVSFDLMGQRRQLGDRSRRDDDRYLFLEALLSARDHVIITYAGSDPRDNQDRPPSVVVDELLEHLETNFAPEASTESSRRTDPFRLRHPLQSFSPRYFDVEEPLLFSYSESNCEGARSLIGARVPPAPFVASALSDPSDGLPELTLESLVNFFRNPAQQFARERLALWLPRDESDSSDDREPLQLDGLERWEVGSAVLDALSAGLTTQAAYSAVRGLGILPLGLAGDCAYEQIAAEATALFERAQTLRQAPPLPPLEIDAVLEGVRLIGRLDGVFPSGRVDLRFSKLGSVSELDNWIHHLVLCAFAPEDWPRLSHQLGPSEQRGVQLGHITFTPVEEARTRLSELVAAQRRGQLSVLPFFPRTSRKYVETLERSRQADPVRHALLDAYDTWRSREGSPGESEDLYCSRLFIDQDPLLPEKTTQAEEDNDSFSALARRVYGPLLAHREVSQ